MLFVLPDGGELEEPSEARIEVVGDRGIPSPIYYRHAGGSKDPGFELKLEVWKGMPVCTDVRLIANPAKGVHIRVKDLKRIESLLENSIEDWLSLVACVPMDAPKGRRRWRRRISDADERAEALRAIRNGRRQIRRKGTGHLEEVAETYNAATGAKGQAVMKAFGVSMPTARRYIKQAREVGLIND